MCTKHKIVIYRHCLKAYLGEPFGHLGQSQFRKTALSRALRFCQDLPVISFHCKKFWVDYRTQFSALKEPYYVDWLADHSRSQFHRQRLQIRRKKQSQFEWILTMVSFPRMYTQKDLDSAGRRFPSCRASRTRRRRPRTSCDCTSRRPSWRSERCSVDKPERGQN